MCTAVYLSPNKCSYTGGKCLFKIFNGGWRTDAISGGAVVRIPQKLYALESRCRGFSALESWCRGTSSFCRILTLMPLDITATSRFSIFHRLLFVLYLLVNTVIPMAIARKTVEPISIIFLLWTVVINNWKTSLMFIHRIEYMLSFKDLSCKIMRADIIKLWWMKKICSLWSVFFQYSYIGWLWSVRLV